MDTRSPDRLTAMPPGTLTGPCPRHSRTSASQASMWVKDSAPAGAPAAVRSSRHSLVRTARGTARRSAAR